MASLTKRPKRPAAQRNAEQQLADLREADVQARMRVREAEGELAAAVAAVGAARQARVEALADPDTDVSEIDKAVDAATAAVPGAEDLVAGARLGATRTRGEIVTWTTLHVGDLVGERAAGDRAAAEAVADALRQLIESNRQWQARASEAAAIGRDAEGEHPGSIPAMPSQIDGMLRAARQVLAAGGEVPPPSLRGVARLDGVRIHPDEYPAEDAA